MPAPASLTHVPFSYFWWVTLCLLPYWLFTFYIGFLSSCHAHMKLPQPPVPCLLLAVPLFSAPSILSSTSYPMGCLDVEGEALHHCGLLVCSGFHVFPTFSLLNFFYLHLCEYGGLFSLLSITCFERRLRSTIFLLSGTLFSVCYRDHY